MSFLLFRSHVSSHLFLPLGFAGNVRPPEEAAQFALISPGEGDQGVLGNPQPEGWNDLKKKKKNLFHNIQLLNVFP